MPRTVTPASAGANPVAHPKSSFGPDAEVVEARDCNPRLSRCKSCPGLHFILSPWRRDGGVNSEHDGLPLRGSRCNSGPSHQFRKPVRNRQRFTVLVRPGAGCNSPDWLHFLRRKDEGLRLNSCRGRLSLGSYSFILNNRRRPSGQVGFIRRSVGSDNPACDHFISLSRLGSSMQSSGLLNREVSVQVRPGAPFLGNQ